ncbi:hypothetical protein EMIHUDRAFT_203210 [Emiliania huxleyi CCMP1516]|uniref:C2H2-type domain-containing protein n=2 Tax=Emiliania huxleyi TaxID=2903 RepID=A0A0D3K5R6_EMIH1|nr:hypothetical protein EMIHUDRAFT_203210 [Emiliania huxleyi CCMP1516]EOD31101.1 hypothetical protein EMIHUDRAFT_203210 [Emiliania huxleyi CCMP1516]|eukprot:XP_005783530.1 hypothetical protein EMIHUDRAFT_203210 [Emiliania huxleyi CCMP1516]
MGMAGVSAPNDLTFGLSKIAKLESELAELGSDGASGGDSDGDGRLPSPTQPAAPHRKRGRSGVKGADDEEPVEAPGVVGLRCEMCGALLREHLQGKKHVCDIAFTSVAQLTEHCKGRKHRDAEGRQRGGGGRDVDRDCLC